MTKSIFSNYFLKISYFDNVPDNDCINKYHLISPKFNPNYVYSNTLSNYQKISLYWFIKKRQFLTYHFHDNDSDFRQP